MKRLLSPLLLLLALMGCVSGERKSISAAPVPRDDGKEKPSVQMTALGQEPGSLALLQWEYLEAYRGCHEAAEAMVKAAARHDHRLTSLADAAGAAPRATDIALQTTPSRAEVQRLRRQADGYVALAKSYRRTETRYAAAVERYEEACARMDRAEGDYHAALGAEPPTPRGTVAP